jgi:transposase
VNNDQTTISQRYKLLNPCRNQIEMQLKCLDDLLPPEHKARAVWEFVDKIDLTSCYGEILSYKNEAGRSTTSPKVLLCLWIYSILDGNISARKIEELCCYHDAYKWIVGGTPVNRTMISEFRSENPEKFEDLLTSCLAVMLQGNVISDQDFAQDGTRVKASAGFNSFHRDETLEALKKEMSVRIKELETESSKNPNTYDLRSKAALEREAKKRSKNIDQALENLKENNKKKSEAGKKTGQHPTEDELKDTRASVTDPEARKMKMGDGGYRLAFNVQFATGMKSRVIFGTEVVNTLDPGTSPGMMKKVHLTLKHLNMMEPKTWNADSAYSAKADIEAAAMLFPNCRYFSPAKLKKGIDPKKVQKSDSEAVIKWRETLETDEMKESYGQRCSTAEFSNAQTKNQGMGEFLVRGFRKIRGMVNLHAISHNITRYWDLSRKMSLQVT